MIRQALICAIALVPHILSQAPATAETKVVAEFNFTLNDSNHVSTASGDEYGLAQSFQVTEVGVLSTIGVYAHVNVTPVPGDEVYLAFGSVNEDGTGWVELASRTLDASVLPVARGVVEFDFSVAALELHPGTIYAWTFYDSGRSVANMSVGLGDGYSAGSAFWIYPEGDWLPIPVSGPDMAFYVTAVVPETSTGVLALAGLGAVAAMRRRRG